MKKLLLTLTLVLTLATPALAVWDHWAVRDTIIGLVAPQIATPRAVLLGDSISEANAGTSLCDRAVLNAGYGGANAYAIAARISAVTPYVNGARVYLMIGTNDAYGPNTTLAADGAAWWTAYNANGAVLQNSYEAWREYHATIITALRNAGATVVLVTVPPTSSGAPVSKDAILQINHAVTFIGSAWSVPVVDAYTALADANGYATSGYVVGDGIHLSVAGYAVLNPALGAVCP